MSVELAGVAGHHQVEQGPDLTEDVQRDNGHQVVLLGLGGQEQHKFLAHAKGATRVRRTTEAGKGRGRLCRASTSRAPSMLPYFLNTSLGLSRMLTTRMASCAGRVSEAQR